MRYVSLLLLLVAAGCQQFDLQRRTLQQASTLTDIQYTQILNNLAMFAVNPDALPYYSAPGTGQTNTQRSLETNPSFGWDLLQTGGMPTTFQFDKFLFPFRASRTSVEQWTTTTTLNPDLLALMRCAYQRTLGYGSGVCEDRLNAYFKNRLELLDALQPGWFGVGSKCDIPRCACYVGKYCHTYVWVLPGGEDNLTRLTLAILDIATALPSSHVEYDNSAKQIKDLEDQAKELSEILDKLKDTENPQVTELRNRLFDVLGKLNDKLKKKTTEGSGTDKARGVPTFAPEGPAQPEPAPFLQPRQNLSQPSFGPIVIPAPQ